MVSKVVGLISGGKKDKPIDTSAQDREIQKQQAEANAREVELKKSERARRAAVSARQRGSRLLMFDTEQGVKNLGGTQ